MAEQPSTPKAKSASDEKKEDRKVKPVSPVDEKKDERKVEAVKRPKGALPPGRLTFRALRARKLAKRDLIGKNSPYCKVQIGKWHSKTMIMKSAGAECEFPQYTPFVCILDGTEPMIMFDVMEEDAFFDDLIGCAAVPLDTFVRQKGEAWYPIVKKSTTPNTPDEMAGEICFSTEYTQFQPGKLSITVHNGVLGKDMDFFNKQDPYVELTLNDPVYTKRKQQTLRTKIHIEGGKTPSWNETLVFDILGSESTMLMQVKDKDIVSSDKIGGSIVDMLDLYAATGAKQSFPVRDVREGHNKQGIPYTGHVTGEIFMSVTWAPSEPLWDGPNIRPQKEIVSAADISHQAYVASQLLGVSFGKHPPQGAALMGDIASSE